MEHRFKSKTGPYCRTCLKCQTIRSNQDKEKPQAQTDSDLIEISNSSIHDAEGFACTGEWIDCQDRIAVRSFGLLSMKYTIQEDVKGWICQECFETMDKELVCNVVCDVCSQKFVAEFGDSTDQGVGCSSTVTDKYIICHYGSCHDFTLFKWSKSERPKEYAHINLMCDQCITQLIEKGVLDAGIDYD